MIDESQIETDVEFLKSQEGWQDAGNRKQWLRDVAVKSRQEVEPEEHRAVMSRLWSEVDDRSLLRKGAEFVGSSVKEVAESALALPAAAVLAGSDALGVTDSGSGTRLAEGVKTMVDQGGQRLKQLAPGESKQFERDQVLESLRKDLDEGAYPDELEDWVAGLYDGGEEMPESLVPWVEALTDGLGRKAVEADYMDGVTPERLQAWKQSDRNPLFADSDDNTGAPGPREFLADYLLTRDPDSWEAFQRRVTETDQQYGQRVREGLQGAELRQTTGQMMKEGGFTGYMGHLAEKAGGMQTSPVDLATAMLPAVRALRAMRTARRGDAAAGGVLRGAATEAAQEGFTEYVMDSRASAEEIGEAAAMGAVGSGVLEAGGAAVGRTLRRLDGRQASATDGAVETIEGEGMTEVSAATGSLPEGLQAGQQLVVDGVNYAYDPMQVTADALRDAAPETLEALQAAGVVARQGAAAPVVAPVETVEGDARFAPPAESVVAPVESEVAAAVESPVEVGAEGAVDLLRRRNESELPAVALQRWNWAAYEAAAEYARTGDMAALEVLTEPMRKRVREAVRDADAVTAQQQEAADQAAEQRLRQQEREDRKFDAETMDREAMRMRNRGEVAEAAERSQGMRNTRVVGRRADGSTVIFGELVGMAEQAVRSGLRYAQWAAEMVRQLGAAVRRYLADAWNAAKKNSRVGAVGDLGPELGAGEADAAPGMRRSQFGERVQADPRLSDELRAEAVSEFPVQGQQATHDQAREMIRGLGLDAALTTFRDDASLPMPLRIAGLMQVAQNFDAQGLAARVSNDSGAAGRADTLLESAVEAKVALESIGNEAGRNLAMFNTWARLSPTGMLARVDRKLAEMHKTDPLVPASIPAEVRPKLERQAAEAMALPEGVLRTAAVADLMAEVSLIEGVKAGDLWWSIWYGNVLSGLATQSINIAGSVENVLLSVAELGTLRPGMLADYIRGLARGMRQGAVEAWSVLRGGPVIKPGKWTPQAPNGLEMLVRQGGPRSDFSSPRAGLRSLNEWAGYLASLGGNTRFVGRLLGGMDAFFYYTLHEGAAAVAVQRALRKGGLKPGSPQFRQEVIRQMGRDSAQYQADLRQAESELRAAGRPVTRQMVMRRAWELVRERRDQGAAVQVQSWADRAVYQNTPAGSGAWVSGLINQIQKLPLAGRLMVPFNTILANLFSRGLDYTGLGLARGLLGYHLTDLVAPPKGGRVRMGEMERRQRAIAGVIGPTVGLAAAAYALQFADETDEDIPFWIYDSGPKDKQRRRQMPQGWQPHSIKVGKRYIKYAETPLGPLLGAVAGYINAERYASEDSLRHKTNGERLALALQASMQQYQDLGVLAGVADFMEVMSGQKRLDKMAQDTGARSLSGLVPVSGFLREVEALFDPEKIHAEGIMEALQRDIPVVSGWGTRPDLNAFAEPLTDPGLPVVKRFASTQKEDPNWSWVRRNELRVPAVDLNQQLEIGEYLLPNQARGKSLQDIYAARGWSLAAAEAGLLTRDQRYHLAKRTGELMKERVKTVRKTMEQQPHGGVLPKDGKMQVGNRFVPARDYLQSRINAIFEASRKQAMAEVVEMATTR